MPGSGVQWKRTNPGISEMADSAALPVKTSPRHRMYRHFTLRPAKHQRRSTLRAAWDRLTQKQPIDPPQNRSMRVVLWGTCDTGKPRVRILRDGLRANGVEVIECRADIWQGIQDKSEVHGACRWAGLLLRIWAAYPGLVWRYLRLPKHDWVLLGYPAIPDIFVIRFFAWIRGASVAMDWFLSAYDTIVLDRRLVHKWHPLAGVLRVTEWVAVRLADCPFMDTEAHARRMERLFGLPTGNCGNVWVGVEADVFRAPEFEAKHRDASDSLRVLFYGQFIPLHGVPTIIEAARLLETAPIEWLLIGRGQEAGKVRTMLKYWPLPKVHWLEWVDYETLREHIHGSDVCLGIFGASDKAASVIPNKVFQVLAAGKPTITRDSPAIRELLNSEMPGVRLIPHTDPQALASAITDSFANRQQPRLHFALQERISAHNIGRQLAKIMCSTIRP